MKRVLITGSSGFLGQNLVKHLKDKFDIVILKSDLLDTGNVTAEIESLGDGVGICFHLAGMSFVPDCEHDIVKAYMVNTAGTLALAELLAKHAPGVHFVFASSAKLYAPSPDGIPIDEFAPLALSNTYARVKRLAEQGLENLAQQKQIFVTILRLFNYSHRSQDVRFFLPSVFQQIQDARNSQEKRIVLGNLDLIRDIGAISDLMNLFEKILSQDPSERFQFFNVCSGKGKKLQYIVEEMIARLGAEVRIDSDSQLIRQGESKIICGNPEKAKSTFDWQPIGSETVADLIDAFLEDV